MNNCITIDRYQACGVIGGAKSPGDRLARMLGRLLGAALRALYDLLTGNNGDPQASGSW